jgi:hypothetical protein
VEQQNIRIEEVGDINYEYPYLEVFYKDSNLPFLEVSVSKNKDLVLKLYPSQKNLFMSIDEWERILFSAKEFFPRALKNEEDYLTFFGGDV